MLLNVMQSYLNHSFSYHHTGQTSCINDAPLYLIYDGQLILQQMSRNELGQSHVQQSTVVRCKIMSEASAQLFAIDQNKVYKWQHRQARQAVYEYCHTCILFLLSQRFTFNKNSSINVEECSNGWDRATETRHTDGSVQVRQVMCMQYLKHS